MGRDWILELKPDAQKGHAVAISLWLKTSSGDKMLEVVTPCGSIEELGKEISAIKLELDRLTERAERELKALEPTGGAGQRTDPGAIWEKMETLSSEEEMFEYFNSFSEGERELIAEYIFSRVNMFKGRGPVFSEHYDAASHVLE